MCLNPTVHNVCRTLCGLLNLNGSAALFGKAGETEAKCQCTDQSRCALAVCRLQGGVRCERLLIERGELHSLLLKDRVEEQFIKQLKIRHGSPLSYLRRGSR
jgi:hypothetical protein